MFDTHCHLNFKIFKKNLNGVIDEAKKVGVDYIVVPGTDIESSKRAVEIAEKYHNIYAAVGIHPHHALEIGGTSNNKLDAMFFYSSGRAHPDCNVGTPHLPSRKKTDVFAYLTNLLIDLLKNNKVVAIGEVGLDKYIYKKTKHQNYQVDNNLIESQKELLKQQIKLALEYDKSLILHNREAKDDFLQLLNENWDKKFEGRTVFHCCEADPDLLKFAIDHKIYIGVDGDVTYDKNKQEFVKKIPLELLVLETDSPFLVPRLPPPWRGSARQARPLKYPNEPKNLVLIAEFIAKLLNVSINQLIDTTTENAKKMFLISNVS